MSDGHGLGFFVFKLYFTIKASVQECYCHTVYGVLSALECRHMEHVPGMKGTVLMFLSLCV
jgi:hypothetical protein